MCRLVVLHDDMSLLLVWLDLYGTGDNENNLCKQSIEDTAFGYP
jgi:hypothetical protein